MGVVKERAFGTSMAGGHREEAAQPHSQPQLQTVPHLRDHSQTAHEFGARWKSLCIRTHSWSEGQLDEDFRRVAC